MSIFPDHFIPLHEKYCIVIRLPSPYTKILSFHSSLEKEFKGNLVGNKIEEFWSGINNKIKEETTKKIKKKK